MCEDGGEGEGRGVCVYHLEVCQILHNSYQCHTDVYWFNITFFPNNGNNSSHMRSDYKITNADTKNNKR